MSRNTLRLHGSLVAVLAVSLVWLGCTDSSDLTVPDDLGPNIRIVDQVALDHAIRVQESQTEDLMALGAVVGTAVGVSDMGAPVVKVYLMRDEVGGIPVNVEGVSFVPEFSGEILALQGQGQGKGNGRGKPPKDNPIDPAAWFPRPVPIGVSTGHPCITAGTIGVRVKMPGNRLFALSNNHIYAGTNGDDPRCAKLSIDDVVIQPGTADGGTLADRIGNLSAFVEIDFSPGAKNKVDAAIASTDDDLLGKATPPDGYGVPPTGSLSPADAIGQKAKKYGRTTGLTSGRVEAINATVNVGYGAVGVARFVGQIIISPGGFSAGGDSGSLILVTVTEGRGRNRTETVYSLGLLFAGGASITVANPIDDVLGAFGVTIDGN